MRVLRGLGGSLLWLLASVVCLVGVLLCVTLVLLPLGVVLLRVGRRLFSTSLALFLPRAARRPLRAAGDKTHDVAERAVEGARDKVPSSRKLRKRTRKTGRSLVKRFT